METLTRKPFQGTANIIRFNWHFYLLAIIAVSVLYLLKTLLPALHTYIAITGLFIIVTTLLSLAVSFYVYDASNFYSLNWLNNLRVSSSSLLVNINAGFDETSSLLWQKYPSSKLLVFDFYDSKKHTEVSIKRARRAYLAFPGTIAIQTSALPLQHASVDVTFCILSAHEIRNSEERIQFFSQLKKALKPDGKIVLAEHVRNVANFLAYNIGAFHFLPAKTWRQTFTNAGLFVEKQTQHTPFITIYALSHNGNTS